ncbi:MAG: nicotinate phosphoribosyltransferase [Candidatus Heimdallarchaeota archaeon]|nr:nicotinate phosphoribosyltransferase [Candidatus Heimdallarchaeota archaeon]
MFYTKNRGLFTDLYELTMSQGYFNLKIKQEATFDLFFRSNPFSGGYSIASGISLALEYLKNFQFNDEEITYLRSQNLFTEDFLDYLREIQFTGSVTGVEEGTVVFPSVPLITVTAPIIEAQLVETALLNIINYSTLISTKAARIVQAAGGGSVIEFGLRRAQGDSAYIGVRAALIGGCKGTSFVQAGKIWNCPIVGTQAHSWVQAFNSEITAFSSYANVFPETCLLLIDTYDVLNSGLPNAIKTAKMLRNKGKELVGVRIDSGDLAYLSLEVYKVFKREGFPNITIVLSNELDEFTINSIVQQIREKGISNSKNQKICEETISHLSYGVGTKLITGNKDGALGGVYKLVALGNKPKIKVSENVSKTINPGKKCVWRITDSNGKLLADVMALSEESTPRSGDRIYHPIDQFKSFELASDIIINPLHRLFMKNGVLSIDEQFFDWKNAQKRTENDLKLLDSTYKRLLNPHVYKVSLTEKLFNLKAKLIQKYTDALR